MADQSTILENVVEIVGAFVRKNHIRPGELPNLISSVHASLLQAAHPASADQSAPELKPAVPIRKSVTDDYIICLEDGLKFRSMKRHLAGLGMTPSEYRVKWGLPVDYPMVAPGFAAKRSAIAKLTGLGKSPPSLAQADDLFDHTAWPPVHNEGVKTEVATGPIVDEMQPEPIADDAPVAGAVIEQPARRRGRPKKVAM